MKKLLQLLLVISFFSFGTLMAIPTSKATTNNQEAAPPSTPVKLLFIHHSVGGHWLAHGYGGLVNALNDNNYYVNDVTYGWEPRELSDTPPKKIKWFFNKVKRKLFPTADIDPEGFQIGNHTDIGHLPEWFLGPNSQLFLNSIYGENLQTDLFGDHSNARSKNPLSNPGNEVENQIIMFKSCFPNTRLQGKGEDPPSVSNLGQPLKTFSAGSELHTVANAKRVFTDLLTYFEAHPDKFFVIVTPPPESKLPQNGEIARSFSNWLSQNWLQENNYTYKNVMVFDLFNVLTSGPSSVKNDANKREGNHHRIWEGKEQHTVQTKHNLLVYPSGPNDDHPSPAGLQKATKEFVPLLNYHYSVWKDV